MNEYQSVDDLIAGVKGNTSFLSGLISEKSGLVLLVIVFGVILLKLLF